MFYIEAQKSLANSDVRDGQVVVVNTPSSPAANSAKKLGKTLNPSPGKGSPANAKKGNYNSTAVSSSGTLSGNSKAPSTAALPSSANEPSPKGKEKEKAVTPAKAPASSPSAAPKISTVKADITSDDPALKSPPPTDSLTPSLPEKKKKTRRGPRKSKKKSLGEVEDAAESDEGEDE